jgi:hypothetical protein
MASKYNLEQLGWFNFEQLVRTLLREIIGNGLSTFSGSVDKGRDAAFNGESTCYPSGTDRWRGAWIFQVKHRMYSSQGADYVRAELKRTLYKEINKIIDKHHFRCDNYVFITNCPLTANDKDEMLSGIRETLTIPYIAIIGESDLQELLDCNPRVVSAFPQILGLSQLHELITWGLHQRSLEFLRSAQSEIATFVATSPYLEALDLLHKQHFCVLSGPPKMGKTCTGYALAVSFSALKFEIYDLRSQRDFYDAYNAEAKQLFICDDVFGDISLQISMRDDWTKGFMRLLGSLGKDHKLVWTAREYILKEALTSSKLKEERPSLATTDKVTVSVDQLTRLERAIIFYNHARFANLPENVRLLLRSDACVKIVDHPNYSPESIRQLCTGRLISFSQIEPFDPQIVIKKVDDFLAQPGEAWKSAYLAAPSGERLLCSEVMASGGSIKLVDLQQRYESSISSSPSDYQSFDTSLTNALGTFLRKKPLIPGIDYVQFYHPSMRDLLVELIQKDKFIRVAYIKQLNIKEISSLAKQRNTKDSVGSQEHRILINDEDERELISDHLRDTLLPTSTLQDVLGVLTDISSMFPVSNHSLVSRTLRLSSDYEKILWIILDNIVPHACSKIFWQKNSDQAFILYWRRLFESLRVLLPLVTTTCTPEYIPELLRRHKVNISVDYWGMVQAMHNIVPTIVEQCIDLDIREQCRLHLSNAVEDALQESDNLNLESNYDDSQHWYDTYESILDDCLDYAKLFPDDNPIAKLDGLVEIFDLHPRLEEGSDDDYHSRLSGLSSLDSNEIIMEIFSDL